MSTSKFWLVWCPSAGAPTYRHPGYESALLECERLARANPGKEFFTLEAVAVSAVAPITKALEVEQ